MKNATQALNKDLHSEDEGIAYTMIVRAAELHKKVIRLSIAFFVREGSKNIKAFLIQ